MPNDIPQDAVGRKPQETAHAPLELPKIVHFDDFTRCGDEVWIECGGQLYRLRKTRQGKLILTK